MSSVRGDALKLEREEAGATPRSSKAHADVRIPLASLPPYVQEQLATFDADGDGVISLAEILRHGAELEHSQRRNSTYRRIIALLLLAWAASMAAIFGVVTAGVAVTRQTVVSPGSNVMTTRDGKSVVQTATARVLYSSASSEMPDSYWLEASHFSFTSDNESWLRLTVLGTARVMGSGAYGSVVKVITPVGTLTLDGTEVSVTADMIPLLTEIDAVPAPTGRHLLRPRNNNVTVCG